MHYFNSNHVAEFSEMYYFLCPKDWAQFETNNVLSLHLTPYYNDSQNMESKTLISVFVEFKDFAKVLFKSSIYIVL